MAKKKDTSIRIVGAFALVLGIVAFCMMFVAAATYDGFGSGVLELFGLETSLTGSQIAFGYKSGVMQVLNFNIVAFLGFFLPLIGGVLALLNTARGALAAGSGYDLARGLSGKK